MPASVVLASTPIRTVTGSAGAAGWAGAAGAGCAAAGTCWAGAGFAAGSALRAGLPAGWHATPSASSSVSPRSAPLPNLLPAIILSLHSSAAHITTTVHSPRKAVDSPGLLPHRQPPVHDPVLRQRGVVLQPPLLHQVA